MALVLKDRVKETSTTTGTGTFTLAGASTGYQSFSVIGNGNTTYYAIYLQGGSEWEVGIGTYTSSGTTLARTTVLASSNSGSAVNFSAGTKEVFVTMPADKSVIVDASGNVGIGTSSPTRLLTLSGSGVNTRIQINNTVSGKNVGLYAADDGSSVINYGSVAALVFSESGTERMRIDTSGNLQFNSGYGSVATAYGCRAWVNFNGSASGTFAGGASTVSRTAGSTTATVTTTNAHGYITGNTVYALTGVAAGAYTVTVLTSTTFTITTVATTVLSAASITFAVNSIRASGNVSSITDNGTGDYTVNFATAMPDANYSVTGICAGGDTAASNVASLNTKLTDGLTTSNCRVFLTNNSSAGVDRDYVFVSIFR